MKRLLFASIILATLLALCGCQTATPPEVTDAPDTPAVIDTLPPESDTIPPVTTDAPVLDAAETTQDVPFDIPADAIQNAFYPTSNIYCCYYVLPNETVLGYFSQSMAPYTEQDSRFDNCWYKYYFKIEDETLFCWDAIPYSQVYSELPKATVNLTLKYIYLLEGNLSYSSPKGSGATFTNVVFVSLDSAPAQFGGFSNAQNIILDGNCSDYVSVDGVIYSKDMKTLVLFPAGRSGSYVIPEGVETVADGAFDYSSVERLTIPKSMKNIGNGLALAPALEVIYFPNVEKQANIDNLSVYMGDDMDDPTKRYKHITAVYGGNAREDSAFKHFAIANVVTRLGAYENGYTIKDGVLYISEGVVSLLELNLDELSAYSFEKVVIPATMDSVSCAYMLNTKAFEVTEGNKYLRSENGIIFSKSDGKKTEPIFIIAYPRARSDGFETRNHYALAPSSFRNSSATRVNFIYGAIIEYPNVFKGCNDMEIITNGRIRTDINR